MLKHDGTVSKLLNQTVSTLNGSIGYFSYLVAIEADPATTCSGIHEVNNVVWIFEINEGVANIAIVGEVDAKIHEVILATARLIHNIFKHGLVDLIWDIA